MSDSTAPRLFVAGEDADTVRRLVEAMAVADDGPAVTIDTWSPGTPLPEGVIAGAILADAAEAASDAIRAHGDACLWVLPSDEAAVLDAGRTAARVLWFGIDPTQPDLLERMRRGGDAGYWEDGTLFLQRDEDLEALISEATLPMARGGEDRRATALALAAAALASCAGIGCDAMRDALGAFEVPA